MKYTRLLGGGLLAALFAACTPSVPAPEAILPIPEQ